MPGLQRTQSRKVILFLPPYAGPLIGPPLCLLSLAAAVREAGFEPIVIDGALQRDYARIIAENIEDALCFGVSLLTGPMIESAIAATREVKRLRPDVPVIFGGWHPSLLPAQTLKEDYVDAVVLQQGELTLIDLVKRLATGSGLDLLPGCWFKRNGRIHQNSDRPVAPLSKLPTPAYDLVNFDAYEASNGERTLPYATSVGCPYACNYCTDTVFYNRRFNAYDARRVAEEVTDLAQRYRLRKVALVDSNFLVNTGRAVEIARGLISAGTRVQWTFQASTDLLCRMKDADVEALAESGVTHIGFGTESASARVLERMNKPHQKIEDMYEAARKCKSAGIRVTYNLIFGYPGETEADRRETLRVMSEIGDRFENVSFSPNMFTPYPGIPIRSEPREMGMHEPQSLAEWSKIGLGTAQLPWLQDEPYLKIRRGIAYFLLTNATRKARRKFQSPTIRLLLDWARKPLAWRIRNYCFQWPVELSLAGARKWLVMRRSLLTGKALKAC